MIINTNKLKKAILFLITLVLLFFGNLITLNMFDLINKIEHKWIVIFLFSLVLLVFMIITKSNSNLKLMKRNSKFKFIILWEIFIILTFISKFLHGNFFLFEFMLFSIVIPISFFNSKIQKYKNVILIASVFSIFPLIRILGPINSLGTIICLAGINSFNLLKRYNSKDIFLYIVLVIFSISIFITESRTSLISFLFVSAIVIFISLKGEKITLSKSIRNSLKILLIIILIYFSYDYIVNLIFGKYATSDVNIFSGRNRIWIGTFKAGISLFGNGEGYFMYSYNIGDAHNTFVQILGDYGLLSFVFFVIIYIYIIFKSIKYLKKIEYICFFSGFLLLSLAENLFFINTRMIYANILFLTYLGCLINERNNNPKKVS